MDSNINVNHGNIEVKTDEFTIDYRSAKRIEYNRDRMAAFDEAIKPMIQFVNKYCTPHDIVVVQQGFAELYSGEMVIPFPVPR